jgi:hypothetical protein
MNYQSTKKDINAILSFSSFSMAYQQLKMVTNLACGDSELIRASSRHDGTNNRIPSLRALRLGESTFLCLGQGHTLLTLVLASTIKIGGVTYLI